MRIVIGLQERVQVVCFCYFGINRDRVVDLNNLTQ